MSQNEKDLLNRIFTPAVNEGKNEGDNTPKNEPTKEGEETSIRPLPLKTVEQLLREAKNPPNTQTG